MGAAQVAGGANHAPAGPPTAGGGMVPFFYGSNQYAEKIDSTTTTLTTSQVEVVKNVNPGGFMRGVRVQFQSASGAAGGATLSGDAPWSVFASITLENIDGAPIKFPMPGYSHMVNQWLSRPWHGDPQRRWDFSATANPSGTLFIQPEIRHTAAVLANTDARAQYRIRYTLATLAQYLSGGSPTAPAVTVNLYLESWAQPDDKDLLGNPIEAIPPGLVLATVQRRQILSLNAAAADNTIQLSNMGNELRLITLLTRNSSNVRADLLSDPIRWRLDNRSLGVFNPAQVFNRMSDFYTSLQDGSVRPDGVYAFPRWYDPGRMVGEPWLATTNATYLIYESVTATGGTNGTIEIITDEVVPVDSVPLEFESI